MNEVVAMIVSSQHEPTHLAASWQYYGELSGQEHQSSRFRDRNGRWFTAFSLVALALGWPQPARADDGSLDFSLPPSQPAPRSQSAIANSAQSAPDIPRDSRDSLAIDFALAKIQASNPEVAQTVPFTTPPPVAHAPTAAQVAPPVAVADPDSAQIFQGGPHSLVAKAVGSAEGTRTPNGDKTWAYYGHEDPGNGVWNLGSFSYQHGANSPEEADTKQLRRLQAQAAVIRRQAQAYGITLTLEEELNAIDLANQAPLAALDRGGYIDWLAQAHQMGLRGSEAVLWARTRSFINPDTGQWNAPGLGNNLYSISADQERRLQAIARAVEEHRRASAIATPPEPEKPVAAEPVPPPTPEQVAEQIVSQDLSEAIAETEAPKSSEPDQAVTQANAHQHKLTQQQEAVATQIIEQDLSAKPQAPEKPESLESPVSTPSPQPLKTTESNSQSAPKTNQPTAQSVDSVNSTELNSITIDVIDRDIDRDDAQQ